jgi:hypothetical protein
LSYSFAAPKESNKEKGQGNVEFLMLNFEFDPCGYLLEHPLLSG